MFDNKKMLVLLAGVLPASALANDAKVHLFTESASTAGFNLLIPSREKIDPPRPSLPPQDDGLANTAAITGTQAAQRRAIEETGIPAFSSIRQPRWMPARQRRTYELAGASGACTSRLPFHFANVSKAALARRAAMRALVERVACETGIGPALLDALIMQESRYNANARSHAGAMGLTQLMPGTARYLGVANAWNAEQNIRGGARYLKEQIDRFGSIELGLAAYNAGPGRVRQYKGIPPFRETRDYVRIITASLRAQANRQ
ncbi:lytic transglycosylase domain-containing protein [Sphingomonadaceae bacterium]|nr:lytic transglycosylase domain-containing protein [Sphingomonadaceae bacterium]